MDQLVDAKLFRDEVLRYVDGLDLAEKVVLVNKAFAAAAREVADATLAARYTWFWPSLARRARPGDLGAPGALAAFEYAPALVLVGGTRDESEPTDSAAALRPPGAWSPPGEADIVHERRPRIQTLAESLVPRNAAACAVAARGDLLLCGGWDGLEPLRSCERFDGAAWFSLPDLDAPRCFAAAVVLPWGGDERLLVLGGGDTLWVGGAATTGGELLHLSAAAPAWVPGPKLREPRCGHGVAALAAGWVVAAGGYGGGDAYLSTAERLGPEGDFHPLPPMRAPRTGAGLGGGPDGCVYVAGGSPDGSDALNSAERLDLRRRAWERLPDMSDRRGYVAAAFDARGDFYVHGGYNEWGAVPRANRPPVRDVPTTL